jgi:ribosomal protein S27E
VFRVIRKVKQMSIGISHSQISNVKCKECENKALQIKDQQGTKVQCAVCRTNFAVLTFGSNGEFSLLKLETGR